MRLVEPGPGPGRAPPRLVAAMRDLAELELRCAVAALAPAEVSAAAEVVLQACDIRGCGRLPRPLAHALAGMNAVRWLVRGRDAPPACGGAPLLVYAEPPALAPAPHPAPAPADSA